MIQQVLAVVDKVLQRDIKSRHGGGIRVEALNNSMQILKRVRLDLTKEGSIDVNGELGFHIRLWQEIIEKEAPFASPDQLRVISLCEKELSALLQLGKQRENI
jgi:hypothetical protein